MSRRCEGRPLFSAVRLALLLPFWVAFSAAPALAKDVYQPVKKDALELGVGFGYAAIPGYYDAGGKLRGWDALFGKDTSFFPALWGMPFRLKYGLGHDIDLKADWDAVFSNADAGRLRGMSQPKLGLRYNRKAAGAFLNFTPAFVTGNLDKNNLYASLEAGGLLRARVRKVRGTALLSYTEVIDKLDVLRASARSDIPWGPAAPYAVLEYAGALGSAAYLLTLTPGARFDLTEALTVDASAPFTVAGRSAPAGWSAKVIFYRTLGR